MQKQLILSGLMLLAAACMPVAASAACDTECQVNAVKEGQASANAFMKKELQTHTALFPYLKTESALVACDDMERRAQLHKLLVAYLVREANTYLKTEAPQLLDVNNSARIGLESFLDTLKYIENWYEAGYGDKLFERLSVQKDETTICAPYRSVADKWVAQESQ